MHSCTRRIRNVVAAVAVVGLAGCEQDSLSPVATLEGPPSASVVTTGNGAPSGAHYNLNIIAVSNPKTEMDDETGGHVIFVLLGNKDGAVRSKILLEQSASAGVFEVLDKNGTDGSASFSLPAAGTYTIWARALGKPGGEGTLTTCATDVAGTPEEGDICSTSNEVFVRGTGKSSFRNVTTSLTTIELDPLLDAAAVEACGGTTVGLFDPCLEGYFWAYDNRGLKLLQLRFYPDPV